MHPAYSVIFLTTLIGAGQGLFLSRLEREGGRDMHIDAALELGLAGLEQLSDLRHHP